MNGKGIENLKKKEREQNKRKLNVYPKQLDYGNKNHKLKLAESIFSGSQKNKWTGHWQKKKYLTVYGRKVNYFIQPGTSLYCRTSHKLKSLFISSSFATFAFLASECRL